MAGQNMGQGRDKMIAAGQTTPERDKTDLHLALNERWIGLVNEMISEGYSPRDVTEAMATALGSALIHTHGPTEAWRPVFAVYAPLRHASSDRLPTEPLN